MLHKYLNAKEIVDRPVLVTYMLGNDADESESLSEDQLKEKGRKPVSLEILVHQFSNFQKYFSVAER